MIYIATFFSHYGALQYFKAIKKLGVNAKLMPVPRKVSASCGTCVKYENAEVIDIADCELDGVYVETVDGFDCVVRK